MSKLYKKYLSLKIEDSNSFYLFENGIFYIFISDDAKIMSQILNLKLTNLNSYVLKCGFPSSQLHKYLDILNKSKHNVKIVNSNSFLAYSQKDYFTNTKVKNLLKRLATTKPNEFSISQIYEFLNSISNEAQELITEIEKKS